MPTSLAGQLVVAISSRALFDFEEENRHFEATDDRAYMQLQLERLDAAAKPGVAFSLVNKLLAFNVGEPRVEVVVLSRNDPVSGMRVFRSAQFSGCWRTKSRYRCLDSPRDQRRIRFRLTSTRWRHISFTV